MSNEDNNNNINNTNEQSVSGASDSSDNYNSLMDLPDFGCNNFYSTPLARIPLKKYTGGIRSRPAFQ